MTHFELQDVMGELITEILDGNKSKEERERIFQNAYSVEKLTKQMVNNGDLILRTCKLARDNSIVARDSILKMIGADENE